MKTFLYRVVLGMGLVTGLVRADALTPFPTWSEPRAVTAGPHEHLLASYFAIDSWSPNKRYMLVLETDVNGRLPEPGERCTLGVVDLEDNNRFIPVTTTACWNFQEAAMAFWMNDDEILFNDLRDGAFKTVIMNWRTGQDVRVLPMPVSAVSEDRTWAVSVNYARLFLLRPDYGYAGPGQDARETDPWPQDDGLWTMDLRTGETRLVLSIAATRAQMPPPKVVPGKPGQPLAYHCHTVISKDGAKIFFLARSVDWFDKVAHKIPYWQTTSFTVDRDGKNLRRCFKDGWAGSHFNWAPDGSHKMLVTATWNASNNPKWTGSVWSTVEFEVGKEDQVRRIGKGVLDEDWHCVYSPDGQFMSGETYWNKYNERPWVLVRLADGMTMPMGSFYVPEKYRQTFWRCDLHARYRPDGRQIAFNSVHEGSRQVYVRDITPAASARDMTRVIDVSARNPRYFETKDGKPWIPIGCNICFDRLNGATPTDHAAVRANFDRWLRAFAANGGNCIRLWAGHASLEVMPEKPGVFDPERTKTLKGIIARCEELGIKVKITLESFRMCLSEEEARRRRNPAGVNFNYNHIFNRRLYAPYAQNMSEFFTSGKCREIYLMKVRYLKELGLGDSPAVYCWELWNEINASGTMDRYAPWSAWALAELKKMFPRQMVVNNLGSFSDMAAYQMYDELATEKDNDFMQIHRYLDAGASLDVCRGPMDVVAASAVRELLDRRPDRPAVVAEIGAVQANHAGPFPYYPFDKEGTLLHDALFGAFFAGSAGCGQFWHWDHQYIDGNNLWGHFRRFAKAIEGLDPVAENFRPFYTETRRLRLYGLRGTKTAVMWCRDKQSGWEDELVHGNKPALITQEKLPFRNCEMACYLPWEDRSVTVQAPTLPPFTRSIVVRVTADAVEGLVRAH